MKKKGTRNIPDFSRKPHGPAVPSADQKLEAHVPATPRQQVVKPHATSMKSGRRGEEGPIARARRPSLSTTRPRCSLPAGRRL